MKNILLWQYVFVLPWLKCSGDNVNIYMPLHMAHLTHQKQICISPPQQILIHYVNMPQGYKTAPYYWHPCQNIFWYHKGFD